MTPKQGEAASGFINACKQLEYWRNMKNQYRKDAIAAWGERHGILVGGIGATPLQQGSICRLTRTDKPDSVMYGDFRLMGAATGDVKFYPLKKDGTRSQNSKYIYCGVDAWGKRIGEFALVDWAVEFVADMTEVEAQEEREQFAEMDGRELTAEDGVEG